MDYIACQAYWSGLPSPPPGALPDPGIEPGSPALQADSLLSEPPGKLYGAPVGKKTLKIPAQRVNILARADIY